MKQKFRIELMEEVEDFLSGLDDKARRKIIYNLQKAQFINDSELFKKLSHTVWEFRTHYNSSYYRLFAFWDKMDKTRTVVVSTHGIEKKSLRTPIREIKKTERIRKNYFNNKE